MEWLQNSKSKVRMSCNIFYGTFSYFPGINVALGPVVGPLGSVAAGGRNWEGFSNDPYLCGALAYDTVVGFHKQGVTTSVKVRCSITGGG